LQKAGSLDTTTHTELATFNTAANYLLFWCLMQAG